MAFHLTQSKEVITKAKKASMPLRLISFHWIQFPRLPHHFQNLLVNVYIRAFPRVVPSAWKAPPWASLMAISLSPQSLSAQMSLLLKERTSLIKLYFTPLPHPSVTLSLSVNFLNLSLKHLPLSVWLVFPQPEHLLCVLIIRTWAPWGKKIYLHIPMFPQCLEQHLEDNWRSNICWKILK